jgi:hypothetical protein
MSEEALEVQPAAQPSRMGRPKGALSYTTLEGREFAREFIRSSEYRESIARRIKNDTLPAAVEIRLLEYAYGKPKERIELSTPGQDHTDLSDMSTPELVTWLKSLQESLQEAEALESAIPAEYQKIA